MSKYPNELRSIRKLRGFTQVQLAEKAELSQPAISAFEIGEIQPTVLTALKLARILGVSVEAIWGEPPSTEIAG